MARRYLAVGGLLVMSECVSVFELARLADVSVPGWNTSGGRWLLDVAERVAEVREAIGKYGQDADDAIVEAADGAVPIYTWALWQVFAHLGAWHEDVSEFGPIDDMEQGARVALYLIAERLLRALLADDVVAV